MSRKDLPLPKAHIFKANSRLTSKRNLSFLQQMDLDEIREEKMPIRKQQINSVEDEFEKEGKKKKNTVREGQTFDKFDLQQQKREQNQCAVCLQSHFKQGQYILECKHLLCNQCFKYWSAVSIKCPVCFKRTQTVLTLFHGSSRTIKINRDHHVPNCGKCGNNNNFHLMYFCDSCDHKCIHTYCNASLKEERQQERWLCDQCVCKKIYQNKYAEQKYDNSQSSELKDFIIQDDDEFQSASYSQEVIDVDKSTKNKRRVSKNKKRSKDGDSQKNPRFQKQLKRAKSKKHNNLFYKK